MHQLIEKYFKPFMFSLLTAREDLKEDSDSVQNAITNLVPLPQANLILSKKHSDIFHDRHVLMLDLDTAHAYIPSSTSGHGHLIINADLTYLEMVEILEVLEKYGIIQHGFLEATKKSRTASLRLPWIKKHDYKANRKL